MCQDITSYQADFCKQRWSFKAFSPWHLHPGVLLTSSLIDEPLEWHHNERAGVSNHRCIVCLLTLCFGADHRKNQSCVSSPFGGGGGGGGGGGNHRWPVKSPHKGPVTPKMFPFDDVIMKSTTILIHGIGRTSDIMFNQSNIPVQIPYRFRLLLLAISLLDDRSTRFCWHRVVMVGHLTSCS